MKRKPRKERSKTNRYQQRTWVHEKNRFGTLFFDKLVAPTPGIFDDPVRCYQINEEWAPIVMGFVSLLTEIRMWQGATNEGFPAIREIQKFLQGDTCGMVDCTSVEDCLFTSPIIAVIVAVSYATQEAATQAHLDELAAAYDGTPQSVGSEIPLTAPNLDSLHNNALCRTMELLAAVYGNGKAISLFLLSDFGEAYQNMIASTRNLWGYAPPWLMHLLGSELSACAPDVDTAIAALTDEAAQLEYACCLYDEMRSAVISEANWNAALSTCAGSLTGNAGIIACLMDFDNDQSHALAFFEVYSRMIERQAAGTDFVCQCAPDGWYWVDLPWEWTTTLHGGEELSPLFGHSNPANGELFAIQFRHRRIAGGAGKAFGGVDRSGEVDTLVANATGNQASGLMLWEEPIVGVWEGRDAVGWPVAAARAANYHTARRQPSETWTIKFHDRVDQGHTRQSHFSNMRLLYKLVP